MSKQSSNNKINQLLGIDEGNDYNRVPRASISVIEKYHRCEQCQEYEQYIHSMEKKYKSMAKREKRLRNVVEKLEMHNYSVVEDTDEAMKQFEEHIYKLESQIIQRQNTINSLGQQMEWLEQQIQRLSQALKQQKEKQQQFEKQRKEQIKNLQSLIFKQISQKTRNEKKIRQEKKKEQIEKYKLKQQIKSLTNRIQEKQNTIKCLSTSNDQLRLQVMEMKVCGDVQDATWVTERKKALEADFGQIIIDLRRENDQLKIYNKSLQFEIKNLIKQAEDIETMMVKTSLQRDIFKKIVEQQKQRPRSMESRPYDKKKGRSGSIYRNMIKMPGLIKQNKNKESMKTTVCNQISEQNLEMDNSSRQY